MAKKLFLFLMLICITNFGVYAQSNKVDVEIHAGGNASIFVDGSKTAAGKGTVTDLRQGLRQRQAFRAATIMKSAVSDLLKARLKRQI